MLIEPLDREAVPVGPALPDVVVAPAAGALVELEAVVELPPTVEPLTIESWASFEVLLLWVMVIMSVYDCRFWSWIDMAR